MERMVPEGGDITRSGDETSKVQCDTSAGSFSLQLHRNWSPGGYDRAIALFRRGYYDHSHFFRVVPNFLVQFGIGYSPSDALWEYAAKEIEDDHIDPPIAFELGMVSFAGSGADSRTSELFICLEKDGDSFGENSWETPIGKVTQGLNVIESLYSGYGDVKPFGDGPDQLKIESIGRKYIEQTFPLLDHFKTCTVEKEGDDGMQMSNKKKRPRAAVRDDIVVGEATTELRRMVSEITLHQEGTATTTTEESRRTRGRNQNTHKISGYTDHKENIQRTEGTGVSVLLALFLLAMLYWASIAISRLSRKNASRSKAV